MANARMVPTQYWSDPVLEELSAYHKLVHLYLHTCPQSAVCGFFPVSPRMVALSTGIETVPAAKEILISLTEQKIIVYDNGFVFLKDYWITQNALNWGWFSRHVVKTLRDREMDSTNVALHAFMVSAATLAITLAENLAQELKENQSSPHARVVQSLMHPFPKDLTSRVPTSLQAFQQRLAQVINIWEEAYKWVYKWKKEEKKEESGKRGVGRKPETETSDGTNANGSIIHVRRTGGASSGIGISPDDATALAVSRTAGRDT